MRVRRLVVGLAVTTAALSTSIVASPVIATAKDTGATAPADAARGERQTYLVLAKRESTSAESRQAIRDAGGRVVSANEAIGLFEVTSTVRGFDRYARAAGAVKAAAKDRSIGRLPGGVEKSRKVEQEHRGAAQQASAAVLPNPGPTEGMDPLDYKLFGLRMVRSDLARSVNAGDSKVLVGVLDSGIDIRNPDLAGQVDVVRSRNFVRDIPEIDGPCEFADCVDPNTWDDSGHGTHVAGTIAAAANGFGVSGVAPDVTLVNIRGGQDSGYLFLKPVADALTYAGDAGLDVVNMSFYVDPWLYNCVGGAPGANGDRADNAQEAASQQLVIDTMTAALDYAHGKGVTLVGSLGNNHEDLNNLRVDTSSPDYPVGTERDRAVTDANCVDLPVEGPHVIGTSALGPSERKADYSNYSTGGLLKGEIEVAAPGGWFRDGLGTATFRTNENLILSTYPFNALVADGEVDKNGRITKAGAANGVIKACPNKRSTPTECGYYAYLQGTSMASPHATGVAALAVSAWGSGTTDKDFGLAPDTVRSIVFNSAREKACINETYVPEGRDVSYNAACVGDQEFNSIYGHGIVDAYAAVTTGAATP